MSHESSGRRRADYLQLHGEETTTASSQPELHFQQQEHQPKPNRKRIRTRETNKRKRMSRPVGVTASISQVSIVPPLSKRTRVTNTTEVPMKIEPDYLKVPDYAFKKMLSVALEGGEAIVQFLDSPEKLQYARHYAQLVNDICFLKLKQNYYEQYYRVVHDAGVWSSALSKEVIKKHHLHRIEFITAENMERRRQTITESLERAEEALEQHKQPTMPNLSPVILAFVRKGQQKLSAEFKRKILLVQWDANDIRLVQAFYELKPTADQVLYCSIS